MVLSGQPQTAADREVGEKPRIRWGRTTCGKSVSTEEVREQKFVAPARGTSAFGGTRKTDAINQCCCRDLELLRVVADPADHDLLSRFIQEIDPDVLNAWTRSAQVHQRRATLRTSDNAKRCMRTIVSSLTFSGVSSAV